MIPINFSEIVADHMKGNTGRFYGVENATLIDFGMLAYESAANTAIVDGLLLIDRNNSMEGLFPIGGVFKAIVEVSRRMTESLSGHCRWVDQCGYKLQSEERIDLMVKAENDAINGIIKYTPKINPKVYKDLYTDIIIAINEWTSVTRPKFDDIIVELTKTLEECVVILDNNDNIIVKLPSITNHIKAFIGMKPNECSESKGVIEDLIHRSEIMEIVEISMLIIGKDNLGDINNMEHLAIIATGMANRVIKYDQLLTVLNKLDVSSTKIQQDMAICGLLNDLRDNLNTLLTVLKNDDLDSNNITCIYIKMINQIDKSISLYEKMKNLEESNV